MLDLSGNKFSKEQTKSLGHLVERLPELKTLNLSNCNLGVAGGHLLKEPLGNCKKLEQLNLFRNLQDVDGLRSLSQILATNTTLKFIDFGFNRLKDEGLKNIAQNLAKNENSSLQILGLRYNFQSDNSVINFFGSLHKTTKLRVAFLKRNRLTQRKLKNIKETACKVNPSMYCDALEKLDYMQEDILNRTLHVGGCTDKDQIIDFFEVRHKCGTVLNIRLRKGPKYPNKPEKQTIQFIEFASEESVMKALVIKKKSRRIRNVKLNIYRAGTSTFFYSKATQAKNSKTNYTANTRVGVKGRR